MNHLKPHTRRDAPSPETRRPRRERQGEVAGTLQRLLDMASPTWCSDPDDEQLTEDLDDIERTLSRMEGGPK